MPRWKRLPRKEAVTYKIARQWLLNHALAAANDPGFTEDGARQLVRVLKFFGEYRIGQTVTVS